MPNPAVSTAEAVSDPHSGIRVAAHALEYLATLVPSDFSWIAMTGAEARTDLERPVVCRPGPGSAIDPATYLDAYRWFGAAGDPFLIRANADRGDVVLGPAGLGGDQEFALLPFTTRFLVPHGLATRTVVYLRDRGPVRALIALDRAAGSPAPDGPEMLRLRRLAPFMAQVITACPLPAADSPRAHSPSPVPISGLTQREEQIARMIARGLSNDEVAQELALSRATVKAHVSQIYRKAGVRTRARLLALLLGEMGGS